MAPSLPREPVARNVAPSLPPSRVAETAGDPPAFIASNATRRPLWHLARVREQRGADAFALVLVADCTGLRLGGSHGYSKAHVLPRGAKLCIRCRITLRREGGAL